MTLTIYDPSPDQECDAVTVSPELNGPSHSDNPPSPHSNSKYIGSPSGSVVEL